MNADTLAPIAGMMSQGVTPAIDSQRQVRVRAATDERAIVEEVLAKHRESNFYKLGLAGEWLLSQAFYMGKQNVVYDRVAQLVRETRNPKGDVRYSENRIMPVVLAMVQLLNSGNPEMELVPARCTVIEDEQAADVSQTVLDYIDRVIDWERLKNGMNWWRAVLGGGVMRFWLDPDAGEKPSFPITDPQTGQTTTVEVQEGEIRAEVFSPWDVHFFPTSAPTPRHVVGTLFTSYVPLEDARARWPEYANQIAPGDDMDAYEFYRRRVEWLNAPTALRPNDKATSGLIRLYEYLEAPTKKFPQGRKIVVAGRTLVENSTNAFADLFEVEAPSYLKMGWVKFGLIPVPGRVWDMGAVENLRPIQVEFNQLKTDLIKHRRANMRARIFVPDGGGITKDQITNLHGQVIAYKPLPGSAPITVVPPIPFGSQVFAELEQAKDGLNEVGMRPQISRGINQGQVRSGAQANMLINQANQPFGVIATDTEMGFADCARLKMALAKAYYSDLKLTRIVGEQKGFAIGAIRRVNLYTDIAVVPGSAMPKDRASFNQMLSEMVPLLSAGGGPNAQRYVNAIIEQLDVGGVKFDKPDQADIDCQDTELQQLARGQFVMPNLYDSHIIHIDRCDVWLKKHPTASPMGKKLVEMHQQQHQLMLARSVMPPMGAMMGRAFSGGEKTTGDKLAAAAGSDAQKAQIQQRQQMMQQSRVKS